MTLAQFIFYPLKEKKAASDSTKNIFIIASVAVSKDIFSNINILLSANIFVDGATNVITNMFISVKIFFDNVRDRTSNIFCNKLL